MISSRLPYRPRRARLCPSFQAHCIPVPQAPSAAPWRGDPVTKLGVGTTINHHPALLHPSEAFSSFLTTRKELSHPTHWLFVLISRIPRAAGAQSHQACCSHIISAGCKGKGRPATTQIAIKQMHTPHLPAPCRAPRVPLHPHAMQQPVPLASPLS